MARLLLCSSHMKTNLHHLVPIAALLFSAQSQALSFRTWRNKGSSEPQSALAEQPGREPS